MAEERLEIVDFEKLSRVSRGLRMTMGMNLLFGHGWGLRVNIPADGSEPLTFVYLIEDREQIQEMLTDHLNKNIHTVFSLEECMAQLGLRREAA